MSQKLKIAILMTFVVAALLATALPYDAAAKGLIPCGGGSPEPACQPCHIFSLVQNIYNWLILPPPQGSALVIAIAILMFAYGGFLMLIPGIGGEKSVAMYTKGKKVLTNTLIGILIIFLAWLTIDTIIKAVAGQIGSSGPARIPTKVGLSPGNLGPWNKIECVAPTSTSPQSSTQSPASSDQQGTPGTGPLFSAGETSTRNTFAKIDVQVNKPPCPAGKSFGEVPGGCTNVGGLPELAVLRLVSIKNNCGGDVKITGGSELGHTSHCSGCAVVDIAFNPTIASCIRKNPSSFGIKKICASAEDSAFSFGCTTKEKFRHLHIEFS